MDVCGGASSAAFPDPDQGGAACALQSLGHGTNTPLLVGALLLASSLRLAKKFGKVCIVDVVIMVCCFRAMKHLGLWPCAFGFLKFEIV